MSEPTTERKTEAENLAEEEKKMDGEIERLEAERAELEAPAGLPTWAEIQAGAIEDLERRERRRGIIPRLLTAAKVRRLEIVRERYEAEMEPLRRSQEEAHKRLEAATAKRLEAAEEENTARYEYSVPHVRLGTIERHTQQINREIRALRGEA